MATVLMERDEANPGNWSEFLRQFIDEDQTEEQDARDELMDLKAELADRAAADDDDGADADEGNGGPGLADRARNVLGSLVPRQAVSRVAALPTPGGLGMVILALVFFRLVIVPVNAEGDTTIGLMWKVLTGGASIPPGPRKAAAAQAQQATVAQAQQTGFAALPSQLWADTTSALDSFWIDHVIG